MRIVFVTSRFPYPVEKGDKLRAFHQIRILSRRHEIHLVAISHRRIPDETLQAMAPYCKSVKVFYINRWLFPVHLLLGWMEGLPLQVSYFFDRTLRRKVQYHIIHLEPEHVICQLIRASMYVRSLPFAKTLDYMDVFSEGMKQLARKYGILGFPFRWEAKRLSRFERSVYKDFDRHVIISLQDRDRLALATAAQVAVIPNGVDESFHPLPAPAKPNFEIVFVGNLGYGPNKEAASLLVNEILPELKRRGLKTRILLAGARPGRSIRSLSRTHGVTLKGWMEDIRLAYADGRIFVAPMFSGLGLQNKILEAMAMGLPCVTTTMVNNAIGAKPGEEILIADSVAGIAGHIERLLADDSLYSAVSNACMDFVRSHYRWENQVLLLEKVIQEKNAYLS